MPRVNLSYRKIWELPQKIITFAKVKSKATYLNIYEAFLLIL